ncbi:hypothetical protein DPSP01_007293 [Paraphaeosphaeria sporulosa]
MQNMLQETLTHRSTSFSRSLCHGVAASKFLVVMLHDVGTGGPLSTDQAHSAGVPELQAKEGAMYGRTP